jgi:hypothetical protein
MWLLPRNPTQTHNGCINMRVHSKIPKTRRVSNFVNIFRPILTQAVKNIEMHFGTKHVALKRA